MSCCYNIIFKTKSTEDILDYLYLKPFVHPSQLTTEFFEEIRREKQRKITLCHRE